MTDILKKEIRLAAHPLSFFFILFGLMFLIPGYPVLCGAFFTTLGIFQSFRNTRESNDIVFSMLLPVSKGDIVKGKFLFSCLAEMCSALLMAAAAAVRMTVLSDAPAYTGNALMNANPFALGAAFVIFSLFNLIFIGGFFRTGYRTGRPFIAYTAAAFLAIGTAETLHRFPGLERLNSFGFDGIVLQLILLLSGIAVYIIVTCIACGNACRRFEKIDL